MAFVSRKFSIISCKPPNYIAENNNEEKLIC